MDKESISAAYGVVVGAGVVGLLATGMYVIPATIHMRADNQLKEAQVTTILEATRSGQINTRLIMDGNPVSMEAVLDPKNRNNRFRLVIQIGENNAEPQICIAELSPRYLRRLAENISQTNAASPSSPLPLERIITEACRGKEILRDVRFSAHTNPELFNEQIRQIIGQTLEHSNTAPYAPSSGISHEGRIGRSPNPSMQSLG